ncbi:hypothetical protein [Kibdelosporangium phytohabitans]|uniref:hypothetical protein n=1 Tax=Kibdelosporangium phytohabitans TaxID=860235 RepID=UPI0009F97992|nr:hypothetical protein [Kibdelosporangium phytohabitans]MBE1464346.1 hypothetical protein [Kibdelosporangium phytohabitans]
MSVEIVSILVLVAVFVLGTTLSINMGVLAFVAAFAVGALAAVAPLVTWLVLVVPGWL